VSKSLTGCAVTSIAGVPDQRAGKNSSEVLYDAISLPGTTSFATTS